METGVSFKDYGKPHLREDVFILWNLSIVDILGSWEIQMCYLGGLHSTPPPHINEIKAHGNLITDMTDPIFPRVH